MTARKSTKGGERRKPYTAIGIKRVPCARCGKPSYAQWNICADGNVPRGLCRSCDVGVNRIVMRYVFGNERAEDINVYAERVRTER